MSKVLPEQRGALKRVRNAAVGSRRFTPADYTFFAFNTARVAAQETLNNARTAAVSEGIEEELINQQIQRGYAIGERIAGGVVRRWFQENS